jgi:hypothetical protein
MKYTDMVLVFLMLLVCGVLPVDYRLKVLERQQLVDINYDRLFDTAVYDSVERNYELDGMVGSINPDGAWKTLVTGLGENMRVSTDSFVMAAVIEDDGFWLRDGDGFLWEAFEGLDRESRILQFGGVLEERINERVAMKGGSDMYYVTFPLERADDWYNTMPEKGMFVVYDSGIGGRMDLVVSGAEIRQREGILVTL